MLKVKKGIKVSDFDSILSSFIGITSREVSLVG
jgi:hypothetical protein